MRNIEQMPRMRREPRENTAAFFGDPVRVNHFAESVMQRIREKTYFTVQPTPESSFCKQVTHIAVEMHASEERIPAHVKKYTDYRREKNLLLEHHAHAIILGANSRIFDLQYQQFVPEEQRAGLQAYMDIPNDNPEAIVAGLTEHRVNPVYHYLWLSS
jgi:hypothetical protein